MDLDAQEEVHHTTAGERGKILIPLRSLVFSKISVMGLYYLL